MAKRFSFDYEDVFSRGSDEPLLFLITDKFRRALLEITDILYWSSSWSQELTDDEWAVIDDGVRSLMEVEVISVTVNPTINVTSGGDGCEQVPPPWVGTPGDCYPITPYPPQPDGGWDAPQQPPETPDSEWNEYRCKLANYGYEQLFQWVDRASQVTSQLGTVAVVLFALWALVPASIVALIGGTLLGLAASLMSWAAYLEPLDEIWDRLKAYLVENREDIVCKFYNATNAEVLREDVVSGILDNLIAFAELRPWWFSQAENMIMDTFGKVLPTAIFLAPFRLVPPVGYVGAVDCCDLSPDAGEFWDLVRMSAGSGTSELMSTDVEDSFSVSGNVYGAGAGNSFQKIQVRRVEFIDVDPDTFVHSWIEGEIDYEIDAAASETGMTYTIAVGRAGAENHIVNETTVPDEAASFAGSITFWVGKPGQSLPGTHDVEIVGDEIGDITPFFYLICTGYQSPPTTYQLTLTEYATDLS